jgi:hypothetical protein
MKPITSGNEKLHKELGEVREGRIPIVDHKGRLRGHVGPKATAVTVARFTGTHGAELKKVDGRDTWVGKKPPPPPPPQFPGAPGSPNAPGAPGAFDPQEAARRGLFPKHYEKADKAATAGAPGKKQALGSANPDGHQTWRDKGSAGKAKPK